MANTKDKYRRPAFFFDFEKGEIKIDGTTFAKTTLTEIGAFLRAADEMVRLANLGAKTESEAGIPPIYKYN